MFRVLLALLLILASLAVCSAHFGVIIPSDEIVETQEVREVELTLSFQHPMERGVLPMERPVNFGVAIRGTKTDLTDILQPEGGEKENWWTARYEIIRPGDHLFFFEQSPYWEASEGIFITHLTKVVVHGLGMETGWDEPVGLKAEIVPLTRPYGLWTGNVFSGKVLVEGKPLADATVEVEHLNEAGVKIPSSPYVTQAVKTDADGVFVYGIPRSGWWGFAALTEDDRTIAREGGNYPVELGAVLWIRARDMR